MVSLQQIYCEYESAGIRLHHWHTPCGATTLEMQGNYAVFVDFFKCTSIAELKWKLAHEYGHASTGATHHVHSPYQLVQQHEFKANKRAALTFIPPAAFRAAFAQAITEPWDLAEHFGLPQRDVVKAWNYYSENGML